MNNEEVQGEEDQERPFVEWLAKNENSSDVMKNAVINWRARCLTAEKRLANALRDLKAMRDDLLEATGSGVGRR